MRQLVFAVVISFVLAACGGATGDSNEQPTTPDDLSTVSTTTEAQVAPTEPTVDPGGSNTTNTTVPGSEAEGGQSEPAPTTEESPLPGQVPDGLIADISADVAQRSGADESDFVVVRAESAIWNDGSLGCPLPGESYTQAIVNGYWVVIEVGGLEYDYRASGSGFFKLCEGSGSAPSNPTG